MKNPNERTKYPKDYTGKTVRITKLFMADQGIIEMGQTFHVLRMRANGGEDMIVELKDGREFTLSPSQVKIVNGEVFDGWSTP